MTGPEHYHYGEGLGRNSLSPPVDSTVASVGDELLRNITNSGCDGFVAAETSRIVMASIPDAGSSSCI